MAATVIILALAAFAGVCTGASNRIVGGQMTSIEQYPSIVQVETRLIIQWFQSCGGNLLNERYILSAAHCFAGLIYQRQDRRIRLGSSLRDRGGIIVYIEREYNHPTYNELLTDNFDGDITVVRLAQLVQYSSVIQPVTIAAPGTQISNNSPVVQAGWGTMSGNWVPTILRHVTIYTIDRQLCAERYAGGSPSANVTENMICAGILDLGGKGSCHGDYGGPLYYGDILVGVMSWAKGCGDSFYPGVSTAVSPYTEWIVATAV